MLSHQYQQQTLHCIEPPLQSRHFPAMHSSASPPEHLSTTMPRCAPHTMADFPQFMNLPAEIRSMVWDYALPDPRVYEIMDVPRAKQKMNAVDGLMFANVHHEPPPALAAVCLESRYVVLKHYRPLTLGRTTKYVDLARDLLLLEPYLLLKRLHRTLHFMSRIPLIRTHMAGLALGTSYGVYTGICHPVLSWKTSKSNMGKLLTGLAKFPKLKTLFFVVHQEFQFEFDYRCPPPESLLATTSTQPHLPPAPPIHSVPNLPSMLAQSHYQLPPPPPYILSASTTSPASSSAYSTPSPQSAVLQEARPQVVHQAYRFKFDVEDNINCHHRRPHLNDLLFYPIENIKADDNQDDWEALLNSNTPSSTAFPGMGRLDVDMDDTESGEWCDPWPTNDDWRRFRHRFQRAVVTTLQSGLVSGGDGQNALSINDEAGALPATASAKAGAIAGDRKYQHFLQQQKCELGNGFSHGHNGLSLHSSHRSTSHGLFSSKSSVSHRRRYSLKHKIPAIKGVSLLWRYTRGV